MSSVLFFGASRGCGHYAALKLLSGPDPPTCTFLLRKPGALTQSQGYLALPGEVRDRKVRIVTGDALKRGDVDEAMKVASELGGGKVDAIVFSIGGAPIFKFPLKFVIDNPAMTRATFTNVLSSLHALSPSSPSPTRIFIVSSNGLSDHTHALLPWPLRIFYTYALHEPHVDKAGLEHLANHASPETLFKTKETAPSEYLYPQKEREVLFKDVPKAFLKIPPVIPQPALLTDGAEKGTAKVRSGPALNSAWTISRADVGAWIAEKVLRPDESLVGPVVLAY